MSRFSLTAVAWFFVGLALFASFSQDWFPTAPEDKRILNVFTLVWITVAFVLLTLRPKETK